MDTLGSIRGYSGVSLWLLYHPIEGTLGSLRIYLLENIVSTLGSFGGYSVGSLGSTMGSL